jgi:hypothetical protein
MVVIEAKMQEVINILTKHDFRAAHKKFLSAGNCACPKKVTTSSVIEASGIKVISCKI